MGCFCDGIPHSVAAGRLVPRVRLQGMMRSGKQGQAWPKLAITVGDPGGIGPEIILKWLHARAWSGVQQAPLIIGSRPAMERAAAMLRYDLATVLPSMEGSAGRDVWGLLHVGPECLRESPGHPSSEGGEIAIASVRRAWRLFQDGHVSALVTGPMNKISIQMAGYDYAGHTELLQQLAGVDRVTMMLIGKQLRVALVTTHVSIRRVPSLITKENVCGTIRQVWEFLHDRMGITRPRMLVCGLNPHAGDGDRFGCEDSRIIAPAVAQSRRLDAEITGPVPADTAFAKSVAEAWDAVIAMYHDQGLAPLKLHAFGRGVNVTLGLPLIRSSVDHGTAFDIVGTGRANEASLAAACDFAVSTAGAMGARLEDCGHKGIGGRS